MVARSRASPRDSFPITQKKQHSGMCRSPWSSWQALHHSPQQRKRQCWNAQLIEIWGESGSRESGRERVVAVAGSQLKAQPREPQATRETEGISSHGTINSSWIIAKATHSVANSFSWPCDVCTKALLILSEFSSAVSPTPTPHTDTTLIYGNLLPK